MPRKARPSRVKSPPAHGRDVLVKVDARLKRRWEELLDALRSARGRGAGAFDELWELAGEVVTHDPPLYVFGGFASAREFFREVLHEEERTARRLIRVARFASPAEEARYGTSMLDAAIAYVEAKVGHAMEGTLPVSFERLRIPVARDGRKRRLPLQEVTLAELTAATRALRPGGRKRTGRASPAREALATALKKTKALAEVEVREAGGYASFARVPVAHLGAFGRAVAAVRPPRAPDGH
jgi:hypothetical protein